MEFFEFFFRFFFLDGADFFFSHVSFSKFFETFTG